MERYDDARNPPIRQLGFFVTFFATALTHAHAADDIEVVARLPFELPVAI